MSHQHRVLVRPVLAPFAEAVALLQMIPGVAEAAARAIVAEIGRNMRRFPHADQT